MFVSGFTFIRNAIIYDYPIIEAIASILPLCDEVIVAVGKSDDDTLALIKSIRNKKIKIIETVWDESLRQGGKVLAVETDKALAAVSKQSDWAIYIQGDECLHEADYDSVRQAMKKYKDDKIVEGLVFDYRHFYGSYDYVADSAKWYRREVRIIRPHQGIYSYKDAQGFRKGKAQKIQAKKANAYVHHYGWVKPPQTIQKKRESFNKLWHDDQWIERNILSAGAFVLEDNIDKLSRFQGTHPSVMQRRIEAQNWAFDYDISFNRLTAKDKAKAFVENLTGVRLGEFKNYKLIK